MPGPGALQTLQKDAFGVKTLQRRWRDGIRQKPIPLTRPAQPHDIRIGHAQDLRLLVRRQQGRASARLDQSGLGRAARLRDKGTVWIGGHGKNGRRDDAKKRGTRKQAFQN